MNETTSSAGRKSRAAILLACLLVLAAGVGMRAWFLSMPGFEDDLQWQLGWGRRICEKGFWDLYTGDFASRKDRPHREVVDYPPVVPLVAAAVYASSGHLKFPVEDGKRAKVEWRMRTMKGFAVAMEAVFLGLAVAWLLRSREPWRGWAAACLVLNPALAFASAGWGQSDSLGILLVFAAFLAESKNRHAWSCLLILLAVLAKLQTVVGLIAYFWVLLAKRKYCVFWIQGAVGFIVLLSFVLLFRICGHSNFTDIYLGAVGAFPSVSWTAWNPWWLAYGPEAARTPDTMMVGPLSLRAWSLLAWLGASAWGGWRFFRSPVKDLPAALLFLGWVLVRFALLPTLGHERYMCFGLIFLCLPAARSPVVLGSVAVMTVVAYLNTTHIFRQYLTEGYAGAFPEGSLAAAAVAMRPPGFQQGLAVLAVAAGLGVACALWRETRRDSGAELRA